MTSGLPSLYRRGTDVFGRRKLPSSHNKSSDSSLASLPPIPSVNDLLVIGRDEIASMKDLKDSLKCIKKLNNSSRLQHHRTKQTQTITSKDIEMFLDSEQAYFDDDDTENDENNDEGQVNHDQEHIEEDNDIEDSEVDHPSFEEDEEDSDPGFSDFITLTDSDFIIDDVIEQNETETNLCENNHEDNNNDSQISSSSSSEANSSCQLDTMNPFDLLQQTSLEEESNIHQIDDALSFVSSIVCNTILNSSSTSNSPLISPSPSNSNSRSNSALITPRNQSSRNNSARSTHGNMNQIAASVNRDVSESTNHQTVNTNTSSPRLNPNPHFHPIPSRAHSRAHESSQLRNNPLNTPNLLNFLAGLNL